MVLDALSISIVGPRPHTYFGPETSASKFKLLHPDFIGYLTERYGVRMEMGWEMGNQHPLFSLFTRTPHIQSVFSWACFTIHWDKTRTDQRVPSTQHRTESCVFIY